MPPPLPRPPLRLLRTPMQLPHRARSWSAQPWGHAWTNVRLSSSTSASPPKTSSEATEIHTIPPESPQFIAVPEPPQGTLKLYTTKRGHLPVPREVFGRRDGARKVTPEHLEATAARSRADREGQPSLTEHVAWKRRHAELRRQSLTSGLRGLWKRKQDRESRIAGKRREARTRNQAAAMAQEPADAVLTRPSIRLATLDTHVPLDPDRFMKAEESAARTAAREARKAEDRRDALQELYVAARDFIVTPEQLEAKVEEVFAEDYWRRRSAGMRAEGGSNVWAAEGPPQTIAQMFDDATRTQAPGAPMDFRASENTRTVERQKQIAEELTGGKMD